MERKSLLGVAALLLLCSLNAAAQPDTMWTRTYFRGKIVGMHLAPDGGILCTGMANPTDTTAQYEVFVMKVTENGDSLWYSAIPDIPSHSSLRASDQYPNGDLLLFTQFYDTLDESVDNRIVRVSVSGEVVSSREPPDSANWMTIAALPDGGVILGGKRNINNEIDAIVTRTDSSGSELWHAVLGDSTHAEYCYNLVLSENGTMTLVGNQSEMISPYHSNGFAATLSGAGDLLWARSYGAFSEQAYFWCGSASPDGGFVFSGAHGAWHEPNWTLKVSSNGDSLWSRDFVPTSNYTGLLAQIIPSSGGGYIAVGTVEDSEPWMIRIGDDGETLWQICCWGEEDSYYNQIETFVPLSDGGYMLGGRRYPHLIEMHAWLMRVSPDPTPADPTPHLPTDFALSNFPNPFNPTTEIEFTLPRAMNTSLRVYDLLGREVATLADGNMTAGTHRITFDGSSLASGVYICRLESADVSTSLKMLLLK